MDQKVLYEKKIPGGEITRTHEVAPNLAVGPAIHIPHMSKEGWTCMLVADECTEDKRFPGTCTKIGLKDARGNELTLIIDILKTLAQWRSEGKRIMIACGAGRSRAPSITSAHMVHTGQQPDMMTALVYLHGMRPEVNPNFGIMRNVFKALVKMRETP